METNESASLDLEYAATQIRQNAGGGLEAARIRGEWFFKVRSQLHAEGKFLNWQAIQNTHWKTSNNTKGFKSSRKAVQWCINLHKLYIEHRKDYNEFASQGHTLTDMYHFANYIVNERGTKEKWDQKHGAGKSR